MFCDHNYEKIKFVYDYYDYFGWHVSVFECKCTKCGKIKRKKFC